MSDGAAAVGYSGPARSRPRTPSTTTTGTDPLRPASYADRRRRWNRPRICPSGRPVPSIESATDGFPRTTILARARLAVRRKHACSPSSTIACPAPHHAPRVRERAVRAVVPRPRRAGLVKTFGDAATLAFELLELPAERELLILLDERRAITAIVVDPPPPVGVFIGRCDVPGLEVPFCQTMSLVLVDRVPRGTAQRRRPHRVPGAAPVPRAAGPAVARRHPGRRRAGAEPGHRLRPRSDLVRGLRTLDAIGAGSRQASRSATIRRQPDVALERRRTMARP